MDGAFARLGVEGVSSAPRFEPSTQPVPEWSGTSRVTLLLLGTDQRDGENAPPRTDTIIVATLDPVAKTAGMISLPRDLWVSIPGYGQDRINSSFELGEQERRGGGAELVRKTVEELLGVPVHH